jgi:hypothetical protein
VDTDQSCETARLDVNPLEIRGLSSPSIHIPMSIVSSPSSDCTWAEERLEQSMSPPPRVPAAAVAAFESALLTLCGSAIIGNQRLAIGIPLIVAGFIVACLAAWRTVRSVEHVTFERSLEALAAMATLAILQPPRDGPPLWFGILYRCILASGLVVVAIVGARRRAASRALWTAIAVVVALDVVAVVVDPRPLSDLWSWTQAATGALLRGTHPYVAKASDVFRGGMSMGYRNTVYPYMPLTAVLLAPAVSLTGDYRFGLVLCLPLTVALARTAGRRLDVDPYVLDAITLALVLSPRSTYLIVSGYNEPLLMLAAAAFVCAAVTWPDSAVSGAAFMLLPALKQYVAAPALMFVGRCLRRRAWRPLTAGLVAVVGSVMPFLIWNWRATVAGILFQAGPEIQFRPDSASLTALMALATGWRPWHWLPELTQLATGGAAFWWLRDSGLAGLLLASAIALDASFLIGTQAFVNYYAFVATLLLISAMVLAAREPTIS